MPTINHYAAEVFEAPDGTVFAHCPCGWMSPVFQNYDVPDGEPPFALQAAYLDRYGHIYRTGQLGLDA